jgi:hypothetical protein
LVLPASVISADPVMMAGQPAEHLEVLTHGRGQHDEVRAGHRVEIRRPHRDGAQLPRRRHDVVAIHADNRGAGKHATGGKRHRPADQPDADDGDAPKVAV